MWTIAIPKSKIGSKNEDWQNIAKCIIRFPCHWSHCLIVLEVNEVFAKLWSQIACMVWYAYTTLTMYSLPMCTVYDMRYATDHSIKIEMKSCMVYSKRGSWFMIYVLCIYGTVGNSVQPQNQMKIFEKKKICFVMHLHGLSIQPGSLLRTNLFKDININIHIFLEQISPQKASYKYNKFAMNYKLFFEPNQRKNNQTKDPHERKTTTRSALKMTWAASRKNHVYWT